MYILNVYLKISEFGLEDFSSNYLLLLGGCKIYIMIFRRKAFEAIMYLEFRIFEIFSVILEITANVHKSCQ